MLFLLELIPSRSYHQIDIFNSKSAEHVGNLNTIDRKMKLSSYIVPRVARYMDILRRTQKAAKEDTLNVSLQIWGRSSQEKKSQWKAV